MLLCNLSSRHSMFISLYTIINDICFAFPSCISSVPLYTRNFISHFICISRTNIYVHLKLNILFNCIKFFRLSTII